MRTRCFAALLVLSLIILNSTAVVHGERSAKAGDEYRKKVAEDIIVGKVQAVYSHVEVKKDWKWTRYIAEVKVEKVKRGTNLKKGQLAYVRYFSCQYVGKQNVRPDTGGFRITPKNSQTIETYLKKSKKDGGLDVVRYGFKILEK